MSNEASGAFRTLSSQGETCTVDGDCGSDYRCSSENPKLCRCPQGKFWSGSACVDSSTAVPTLGTPTRQLTSLIVTWSAHSSVSGVSSVQYQVSWNGAGSPQTVSGLSHNISGLASGTAYSVMVKTLIPYGGRTEMSNDASGAFRTLSSQGETCTVDGDCGSDYRCSSENPKLCRCPQGKFWSGSACVDSATAVPTLGTATPQLTSLNVTWSAHSSVSGVSGVQYQVSWNGAGSPQTVSGLSYTIANLASGTTYSVVVKTLISYGGRTEMSNDASGAFRTLSSDGQTCSGNGDCGSGFVCSSENPKQCRCPQTKFWSGAACVDSATAVPTLGTPNSQLTSLTVTWSAHSSVSGVSGVQYQVSWNGTGSPQTVSGLLYTIQNLASGTTYSVMVKTLISYGGRTEMSNDASGTYETLVAYRGTCSSSQSRCSDPNASCFGSTGQLQCVCNAGFFWNNSTCTSIEGLKPSSITTGTVYTDSVDVSWTLSPSSSFVNSYILTTSPPSSNITVQGGGSSSTKLSGLVPGGNYTVSVSAFISADLRDQTTSPRVSSPLTLKPEKPLGLLKNESTLNETFVDLVFLGVARGYANVYLVTLVGKGTVTVPDSGNDPTVTAKLTARFEQLSPGVTYTVTIVARSNVEAGENFTDTVRTASKGPSEVTQFSVTNATTTSIWVTWSQPDNRNGDLFAYELRVLLDNKCLQSITFTCSVCMHGQRTSLIDVSSCGQNLTEENNIINETTHTIPYEIVGLNPDTEYTLSVVGYTDGGAGEEKRLVRSTEIAPAETPTNPTGTPLNSTSIQLMWEPRPPRPGPTTYHIALLERDMNVGQNFPILRNFTVQQFETESYTVSDLSSHWEYKFAIRASTPVGESAEIVSSTIITNMAAPGHVAAFEVTRADVTSVTVSVQCPALKSRNGVITKFMIKYNATPWYNNQPVKGEMDDVINASRRCSSTEREDPGVRMKTIFITPEYNYTFAVYPVNSENTQGAETSTTYAAHPGPPPSIPDASKPKPQAATYDTYIAISVCKSCLLNNASGIVRLAGIVMCKDSACPNSRRRRNTRDKDYYQNLPSYEEAKKAGFPAEFRATGLGFVEDLNKESGNYVVVNVGQTDQGLPRGATFYVKIFTCTNGGCVETPYASGFVTNADPTPAIIGGVIGGIAAAILVILIVVFILYKRKAGPWKSRDSTNDVIIPDVPKQEIARKRPVKLKDFNQHVYEMHKDSNLRFSEEFEDLTSLSPKHPKDVGSRDDCKVKNRYVNILPFDHSRVKLLPLSEHDSSDYINANYLPGYNAVREYIACQGALAHTVSDFWRMIWEQKCNVIVCLSDLMEKGRAKVDQYWPSEVNSPETYGEIEVETTSSSTLNKYVIRVFNVSLGDESRQVKQFFLPGWEDYSANLTPDDVIEFIKMVRLERKPSDPGPMVVHCSAGVGRTGTFIALDVVQQFIRDKDLEAKLDIFALVLRMRENREYMVQTEKQYIFIFDTTKEILDRKIKAQQELDHIYGNDENVYENQGFTNDADIYVNMENGKPTTQL